MKIRSIEPVVVSLPMTKPIKMAGIEIGTADNVLVRITAGSGLVGWGESASAPTMTGEFVEGIAAAVAYLAPALVGRDVTDIDGAAACMDERIHRNASARAAIEMALHDLAGRALGLPVHALLGGKRRDRIPVLRMLGSGVTESDCPDAKRLAGEGFVAWKIKVGLNDPTYDAERTKRICEVLGHGHLVSADANQGWSVEQALVYVRSVDGCGLAFLEQPVNGHDLAGMARIARSSGIQIAADEGLHGLGDIRSHHEQGAAAGGSLKSIKLGGLRPVMAAASLCDELGMKVNLACKIAESGIASAAVLHVAAAAPNIDWGVSLSSQYLAEDVVRRPNVVREGHVAAPDTPGLGIEVDEAKVARYAIGRH
jgi:muconate cycloisomerase